MHKKIFVIGSNAFSGSDFIDLLLVDPQNEIIGISRSPEKDSLFLAYKRHKKPKFSFHQLDLNRDMTKIISLLGTFQPEYIVNFAAQSEVGPSWKAPWDWFETNTVSLAQLVNYLKDAKYLKKYVHISSPEVYGSCHGTIKEDAPFNPSTPYAASKAAADLLLFTYFKTYRLPLNVVRATNVYGAHQQLFKIVPRTIITIKSEKILELHGGGKAIKSYIHIRDISRGELAVMEKGRLGEIYHFSPDGNGIAVRDVVKTICAQMQVDFDTCVQDVDERLGQDNAYVIDSTKARKEFGWAPVVGLKAGIAEVNIWINDNWSRIHREPLEYIHRP